MPVLPPLAIDLAKRFEGLHQIPREDPMHAYPYRCPAGVWTIGYGHLCEASHPPITQAQADQYLLEDLQIALAATLRHCPGLALEPEARLVAIIDFTFNLGAGRLQASTLRRRIVQRDWPSAAQELSRWVYCAGRRLPGLVQRREVEAAYLLQ